jgi:hypothetical protein
VIVTQRSFVSVCALPSVLPDDTAAGTIHMPGARNVGKSSDVLLQAEQMSRPDEELSSVSWIEGLLDDME